MWLKKLLKFYDKKRCQVSVKQVSKLRYARIGYERAKHSVEDMLLCQDNAASQVRDWLERTRNLQIMFSPAGQAITYEMSRWTIMQGKCGQLMTGDNELDLPRGTPKIIC